MVISSPAPDVSLHFSPRQHFSAVFGKGAGHPQFIQQLVHQKAGLATGLQHQGSAVHRAEVALQQEVCQALLAIGMSTGGVQWPDQRLKADVAHKVIIHLLFIVIFMVLLL